MTKAFDPKAPTNNFSSRTRVRLVRDRDAFMRREVSNTILRATMRQACVAAVVKLEMQDLKFVLCGASIRLVVQIAETAYCKGTGGHGTDLPWDQPSLSTLRRWRMTCLDNGNTAAMLIARGRRPATRAIAED